LRQAVNKFLQVEAGNINANTNADVRKALTLYTKNQLRNKKP